MRDKEILIKAIEKAITGGWITNLSVYPYEVESNFVTIHYLEEDADMHAYEIIFNHGFAKALWGAKWAHEVLNDVPLGRSNPLWQYHLQMMVVADKPIEYLGNNL